MNLHQSDVFVDLSGACELSGVPYSVLCEWREAKTLKPMLVHYVTEPLNGEVVYRLSDVLSLAKSLEVVRREFNIGG